MAGRRLLRVVIWPLLLLVAASAWAQFTFEAKPAGPLTPERKEQLRGAYRTRISGALLFAAIRGRIEGQPTLFKLGEHRVRKGTERRLFCVSFDAQGNSDERTPCNAVDDNAAIAFYSQEVVDAILENEHHYKNGKGGPYYGVADFIGLAFLFHDYYFLKLEDCIQPARPCADRERELKEQEARINRELGQQAERPYLLAFAKAYSGFAEALHRERGDRLRALARAQREEEDRKLAAAGQTAPADARAREEALREARRVELKAGRAPLATLRDAELFYDAEWRLSIVSRPPTAPDRKRYVAMGYLERREGELYIVRLGEERWAFRPVGAALEAIQGLRFNGEVGAVGRLVEIGEYRAPGATPRPMAIFDADFLTPDPRGERAAAQ
ncbi:MAG: hypothetical protein HY423_03460 [Candidatus Lambdaproteobacteria bacterium]|nr:hypothetical protein [Candidatus Lambdaproteobacteria bacterium]